ncbi:hypothetical protein ACLIJR_01120 [Hydrogenophaga sp. XSHU_21]
MANDTDESLRNALRASLAQSPREDSAALEQRVLVQWQQRHAQWGTQAVLAGAGSSGGVGQRTWIWAALALLVLAGALAYGVSLRNDALMEELMQPDVLSQMGLGEL